MEKRGVGTSETRRKKTWYGLTADATIGPGFLHKAGFGRLVVPHPPVANWLLRIGMPEEAKRGLVFAHEFAHFDTAPIALLYMGALLSTICSYSRFNTASILIAVVSTHGAWEMFAESLVVLRSPERYRRSYGNTPKFPRILFWLIGALLAAAGWKTVMQHPR